MTDCSKCKDYRKCQGKEWYSYQDIRWCPFQIMFILEHRHTLGEGNWPSDPGGHTDSKIKAGFRNEAYFAKPAETIGEVGARSNKIRDVISEVSCRLTKTGAHGQLLIAEIEGGKSLDELSASARSILMYLKGWRRKTTPYSQWLASRNYYKKYNKREKE